MRVLAIGGRGQLGADFVSSASAISNIGRVTQLHRPDIDLGQPERLWDDLAGHEFDVLVNFAAEHKTDEVEANAGRAFTVNAHAIGRLAALCRERDATFVQISTDYVFGGDWDRRTPLAEDDRIAPVNVYGASKALGEVLAKREHERVVIVRVASLFGVSPDGTPRGNFVETMLRVAQGGKPLGVVADQIMSPTATLDAAQAIASLVSREDVVGDFHVVNSGSASWYELAAEVFKIVGIEADLTAIPSEEYPTPATRPRYCVLDNRKASDLVGAMPHWRDALRRYLEARRPVAKVEG